MAELKSRHAFGSEANIQTALSAGAIDAFDILFLSEGKIGWVDKNGVPVILENKNQIVPVTELPDTGEEGVLYVCDNKFYYWNGEEFKTPNTDGGITESEMTDAINSAAEESLKAANAYTNAQIEEKMQTIDSIDGVSVVEF